MISVFEKVFEFFNRKEQSETLSQFELYKRGLESGEFKDKFYFGSMEYNGSLKNDLKDFINEPHALIVGMMGTGKSIIARNMISTFLMSNGNNAQIYVAETCRGALYDYEFLLKHKQVQSVVDKEGFEKLIDLLYSELIARDKEFARLGAVNLYDYEKKVGYSLNRIVTVLEELHYIFQNLDMSKNDPVEITTEFKFKTLLRKGSTYGIWFIGVAQKVEDAMPNGVVGLFSNKCILKTSTFGRDSWVLLGDDQANNLARWKFIHKLSFGEAEGLGQSLYISEKDLETFLKKNVKQRDAINLVIP